MLFEAVFCFRKMNLETQLYFPPYSEIVQIQVSNRFIYGGIIWDNCGILTTNVFGLLCYISRNDCKKNVKLLKIVYYMCFWFHFGRTFLSLRFCYTAYIYINFYNLQVSWRQKIIGNKLFFCLLLSHHWAALPFAILGRISICS